jgi:hypothetical protein
MQRRRSNGTQEKKYKNIRRPLLPYMAQFGGIVSMSCFVVALGSAIAADDAHMLYAFAAWMVVNPSVNDAICEQTHGSLPIKRKRDGGE